MSRLIACLLIAVCSLYAQAEEAWDVDVRVGFADKLPADASLVPVFVTITNKVENRTGRIVVRSDSVRREVTQVMPFESAKMSTKTFVLVTRAQDNAKLMVTLEFDQNVPDYIPRTMKQARVDKQIVLSVGMRGSDYNKAFAKDVHATADHYLMYDVNGGELTDQALAYDCVDAIVLDTIAFSSLPMPVVKALADWVHLGGVIIFHGQSRSGEFVARLAPFDITAGDVSEVGITQCGIGWIGVDGLDPTAKPVFLDETRREEARTLFPRILEGPTRLGEASMGGPNMGPGILDMLTKKEGTYGFRGFMWLTLIIVSYLVVIGPLDWWLVKKLGRPYLTWFFFIAAIAVFSVVAYWYSSFVHSDVMQAVQINIVDASVNGDIARGESMYWVYSTKNFRYEFSTTQPDVVFSAREGAGAVGSAATVTVMNGEESKVSAKIPIFTAKTLDATWLQPWDRDFAVDTIDGRISLTPPEGMRISSMQLADSRGLTEMVRDGESWVESGRPSDWKKVLSTFTSNEFETYFDVAHDDKLPPRDKLEGFIRFISLAGVEKREELGEPPKKQAAAANGTGGNQPIPEFDETVNYGSDWRDRLIDTMQVRDGRETALNASGRVRGTGQMVLIFLEDEQLLDLTLSGLPPDQLSINVIRLQLP